MTRGRLRRNSASTRDPMGKSSDNTWTARGRAPPQGGINDPPENKIPAVSYAEYPARGPKTVDTEQHGNQRYPSFRRRPARVLGERNPAHPPTGPRWSGESNHEIQPGHSGQSAASPRLYLQQGLDGRLRPSVPARSATLSASRPAISGRVSPSRRRRGRSHRGRRARSL